MHPGIHRTSAAAAALALLAACGSDDPTRDPSDDTPPGEDTAPPEPEPPRPVRATFLALVGWDDAAGAVREVGMQGALQPPAVILELWSQDADLLAPLPEHVCQVRILADYTAALPEEGPHRVVLEGTVSASMLDGCEGWDLGPIGGDDPEWHASLTWRLALGGPVHEDAQLPSDAEEQLLGATLEVPGVLPETHALIAAGAQVDEAFHVLVDPEGDYVTMGREEMLDAEVLADGLYMLQTTRPLALAP